MSLLVTSCTMGKQPDRLLNKGPQYLRTRTNAGMFGQHKKSAVELLAASKAQFYNISASVSLDNHQDLAVSFGQHERYAQICASSKRREPTRSKSQYDLSVSHLTTADKDNDDHDNASTDDSGSLSEVDALKNNNNQRNPQDDVVLQESIDFKGSTESASAANFVEKNEDASDSNTVASFSETAAVDVCIARPKLTLLRSASETLHEKEHIYQNITPVSKPAVHLDVVDGACVKKPVPLPRKSKEKPIPPPRRFSVRTPLPEKEKDSHLCLSRAVSSPVISHISWQTNKYPVQETPQGETQTLQKGPKVCARQKYSLVESLTKRFTALSAASAPLRSEVLVTTPVRSEVPAVTSTPLRSEVLVTTPLRSEVLVTTPLRSEVLVTTPLTLEVPYQIHKEDNNTELKDTSRITGTFTATPVYIGKTSTCSPSFQIKRVFIYGDGVDSSSAPVARREPRASNLNSDHIVCSKGRKRCPDVIASNSAVKKERRSSEISNSRSGLVNSFVSRFVPVRKSSSTSTSRSEMSIESVDQAVFEASFQAIPSASMEGDNLRDQDDLAREVTRSNSSLSGKMESQDSLPHPSSPTVQCTLVPRSHSDIGCCLESQRSRDSSLVSSHSRLSRASIGADLEQFFNQMGLEKGVLEPATRLRELQASEVFESISSLDSHDAASICSAYSRSEHEWSDSQSVDRSQQQTSVVERNARIIKWLCNVKKAKGQQPAKLEAAAAGKI